jgi:serine-type D-Ala-D-Ala carboxypeptidase/endopeptidase
MILSVQSQVLRYLSLLSMSISLIALPTGSHARPSDARLKEIKDILVQRIDRDKRSVGMVAVVVQGENVQLVPHGVMSLDTSESVTADTLFEIGSITKTFTALLLADMVVRGEVKLGDPVERWLPEGRGKQPAVKLRDRDGEPINLLDLATHRSGLPRLPDNMSNLTTPDPYLGYGEKELLTYLKSRQLQTPSKLRDESYEYSNLGYGLLGYVLARAARMPYGELLEKRVFKPLGLKDTYLRVRPVDSKRFSQGHHLDAENKLKKAAYFHFDVIAPAGAIVMSARDMARYAQAASGAVDSPLKAAFLLAQKQHAVGATQMNPQGLAWILAPLDGRKVLNHNGQTGGFTSSLWLDPDRKVATAILSNSDANIDDIALHLLEPTLPLADFASLSAPAVAVDDKVLMQYVGNYVLTPAMSVKVSLRGSKLFAQATGQGEFELFAKSDKVFFARVTPLEIAFEEVKNGKAMRFQLTQGGATRPALRAE